MIETDRRSFVQLSSSFDSSIQAYHASGQSRSSSPSSPSNTTTAAAAAAVSYSTSPSSQASDPIQEIIQEKDDDEEPGAESTYARFPHYPSPRSVSSISHPSQQSSQSHATTLAPEDFRTLGKPRRVSRYSQNKSQQSLRSVSSSGALPHQQQFQYQYPRQPSPQQHRRTAGASNSHGSSSSRSSSASSSSAGAFFASSSANNSSRPLAAQQTPCGSRTIGRSVSDDGFCGRSGTATAATAASAIEPATPPSPQRGSYVTSHAYAYGPKQIHAGKPLPLRPPTKRASAINMSLPGSPGLAGGSDHSHSPSNTTQQREPQWSGFGPRKYSIGSSLGTTGTESELGSHLSFADTDTDDENGSRPLLRRNQQQQPAAVPVTQRGFAAADKPLPLPSNVATLTPSERADQARRNQKLTRLLGEESTTATSSLPPPKPSQTRTARRRTLNLADAESLYSVASQSSSATGSPHQDGGGSLSRRGSAATTTTVGRKRSISFSGTSLNLSSQGTSHHVDGVYHPPTTPPISSASISATLGTTAYLHSPDARPVNVQPKAAALLGLHPGANHRPATSGELTTATTTLPKTLQKLHLRSMSVGGAAWASAGPAQPQPQETGTGERVGRGGKRLTKEERRKKVVKMSRWLGTIVPPELIRDTEACSPISPTGGAAAAGSLSSSSGLIRALRRDHHQPADEAAAWSAMLDGSGAADDLAAVSIMSPREIFASVRKASKLEKVFGERVPAPLILSSQRAVLGSASAEHYASEVSSLSSGSPRALAKPLPETTATATQFNTVTSDKTNSSGHSYRHSISSLEFLIDTDRDLLGEIIAALDEADGEGEPSSGSSSRGSSVESFDRIAAWGARPPLQRHSSSNATVSGSGEQQPASAAPTLHPQSSTFFSAQEQPNEGDSQEVESLAPQGIDDEDGHHEMRRHRARKAQRLSKFFGETVPLDGSDISSGGIASSSSSSSATASGAAAMGSVPRKKSRLQQARNSFLKLMDSFEGEVAEDPSLTEMERIELERKTERVRNRGAQALLP